MTTRVIGLGPNHIVGYKDDGTVFTYKFTCQTCGTVIISDGPHSQCVNPPCKSLHLIQDLDFGKDSEVQLVNDNVPDFVKELNSV